MKILVVGDGHSIIHEVAVYNAFKKLGHKVAVFYWHNYFNSQKVLLQIWLKLQNKFIFGPIIRKINQELVKKAKKFKPNVIFVYRGTHITAKTIIILNQSLPNCYIIGYNNDDPFAPNNSTWLWRHFINCLLVYDLVLAYRRHNIAKYLKSGAKRVDLLMPWYVSEKDYPITKNEEISKKYDVVFVGHYEKDSRIKYIEKIAQSNFSFGLFGPDWDSAPKYSFLKKYKPILPVRGYLYRKTIISAKIALCFLSSLNRDTYTRRCFEIPAMGVLMLCQYTEELGSLFKDGVDAVFFHNPDDLIEKITYYLHHDELRERIAKNGRKRVINDKHDVTSRMDNLLNQLPKSNS